jgi:sec-independent protein translocase protein TatA
MMMIPIRGWPVEVDMGLDNPLHILILAVIVMLVFGAKRLPELGKSLGTGIREFKGSVSGVPAPAQIDTPDQG